MTGKAVIPRRRALLDVNSAVDHYRTEAGIAVALGFIDALEAAYRHIGQHPASGSPRYAAELNLPGLRVWPLPDYPYLVFYREDAAAIDVWRVLHAQRDIPASLSL